MVLTALDVDAYVGFLAGLSAIFLVIGVVLLIVCMLLMGYMDD